MLSSVITGTGCYIPPFVQTNLDFAKQIFYSEDNHLLTKTPEEIAEKFKQITGIAERRYTTNELNASDIGFIAAEKAVIDSGINRETLDQIIIAQNFGNVIKHSIQTDAVPSLASRIKHKLGIRNTSCIAYDILFGCPGWIQAMIHADSFFKAGIAKKVLIVGTETLSRVIDMYDRDSMIFSDGAGAAVLECKNSENYNSGILGTAVKTYSLDEVDYINMGKSYSPKSDPHIRYIKMKGRKVYEFAMQYVPAAMKECLERSGIEISDLKKIFLHQANQKMDEGILKRFYKLYGINQPPEYIMPMSIHWLGNSSVSTVPTLFDLVRKNKINNHFIESGDIVLFASVGAGMNINAVCYKY